MVESEKYSIEEIKKMRLVKHFLDSQNVTNLTEDEIKRSGEAFCILARDLERNVSKSLINNLKREYGDFEARRLIREHLPRFFKAYTGYDFS